MPGEDIDAIDNKTKTLENNLGTLDEVKNHLVFMGNWGSSILLPLIPHNQRQKTAAQLVEQLKPKFDHYPSIDPVVWNWDTALPGIDNLGDGSELGLVISTTDSFASLAKHAEQLKTALVQSQQFASVNYELRMDAVGYTIDIDYNEMAKHGITPQQIAKTIEVFFSGDKSQTFEKDGILYTVTLKGTVYPWTLNELYITTSKGEKIS